MRTAKNPYENSYGQHGYWCGSNWTGGYPRKSWDQLTDGQRRNAIPPLDGMDSCCQDHDRCYGKCREQYPCDEDARADCYFLKNKEQESLKSYQWCLRAAEKGHNYAQFRIGKMYAKGVVVKHDKIKADYWYSKSAENGFVLAQRELGYNYTNAVPEDAEFLKGVYWYEKAAEQGDKESENFLVQFYLNGNESYPPNKEKAEYWIKKSQSK